jgi:hypothetical protein
MRDFVEIRSRRRGCHSPGLHGFFSSIRMVCREPTFGLVMQVTLRKQWSRRIGGRRDDLRRLYQSTDAKCFGIARQPPLVLQPQNGASGACKPLHL